MVDDARESADDFLEALSGFTNYVQNERIRCYNEGLDFSSAEVRRLRGALQRIASECDAMNKGPVAVKIAREALAYLP